MAYRYIPQFDQKQIKSLSLELLETNPNATGYELMVHITSYLTKLEEKFYQQEVHKDKVLKSANVKSKELKGYGIKSHHTNYSSWEYTINGFEVRIFYVVDKETDFKIGYFKYHDKNHKLKLVNTVEELLTVVKPELLKVA